MQDEVKKLQRLIENAGKILIASHIGPDGDAVASSLLLYKIFKLNYPQTPLQIALEEKPYGLDFLPGVNELEAKPLLETLEAFKPDLLIILDANNVNRISRRPDEVREYIKSSGLKLVIIDHHEPENIEANHLYINSSSPAVTLDVYEIFFQELSYEKPDGYAQIAATGIYTDTGGFINRNLNYRKTFEVIPKLIADGADLEEIANNLNRISENGFKVLRELIDNTGFGDGYTFSYISDEVARNPENLEAIRQATDIFRSEFLRNIDSRSWGFIIYRDSLATNATYSASFRAVSGGQDVSKIAGKLGGGGHKPAAGAKFEANSLEEAIKKVQSVIMEP